MNDWVLLPGLWRSSQHWQEFPNRIRRNLKNVTLHTPDFPGFGALTVEKSPIHIHKIVDHARASSWFQQAKKPLILAGYETGGLVALSWQNRFANEIKACIAISTHDRFTSKLHHRIPIYSIPKLLWYWGLPASALTREELFLELTSKRHANHVSLAHQFAEWQLKQKPTLWNFWRQLLATYLCSAQPWTIQSPTLLIGTKQDRWADPSCTERLAQHLKCRFLLHPTSGHNLVLDEPA